jgi:hypothetical protein
VKAKALLLALCIGAAAAAGGAAARTPKPVIAPGKGETCIAATEIMRRDHMRMLKHQRDETVHAGVRGEVGGKSATLQGCVECHAGKKTGSVAAAKEDFCVSCHAYAAVKIDCFECHATRPKAAAQAGAAK